MLGPADAEDAWSETFLAALRAYPDVRHDSNLEAWLVTIARRKAIDARRAGARRPETVPLAPELATTDGLGGRPWADDDLWAAMRALPERQRQAVLYHHVAGLPYAEIATMLGNSEAAARRAAADGIKRLRASIDPRGDLR
jgi:RNA polymerase sigma factor (sigma-70 family)